MHLLKFNKLIKCITSNSKRYMRLFKKKTIGKSNTEVN